MKIKNFKRLIAMIFLTAISLTLVNCGGTVTEIENKGKANGVTYALTESPEGNGIIYESHIYPWKSDIKSKVLCIADSYPMRGCYPIPTPTRI